MTHQTSRPVRSVRVHPDRLRGRHAVWYTGMCRPEMWTPSRQMERFGESSQAVNEQHPRSRPPSVFKSGNVVQNVCTGTQSSFFGEPDTILLLEGKVRVWQKRYPRPHQREGSWTFYKLRRSCLIFRKLATRKLHACGADTCMMRMHVCLDCVCPGKPACEDDLKKIRYVRHKGPGAVSLAPPASAWCDVPSGPSGT